MSYVTKSSSMHSLPLSFHLLPLIYHYSPSTTLLRNVDLDIYRQTCDPLTLSLFLLLLNRMHCLCPPWAGARSARNVLFFGLGARRRLSITTVLMINFKFVSFKFF